jgi:MYXO-CTERM domain-containing protein
MRTRVITSLSGLAAAAAITLAPLPAGANGVFPTAGQIVLDPADPAHIVVRTTYGVLTTRAAGEPWDWICESAVGYAAGFHPAVALTEDGTLIAGVADGLAVAHADTCTWTKAMDAIDGAYVVDVSTEKLTPSHAVAVTSSSAAGPARFWTSDDNAVTWTQAGSNLPSGFVPASLDTAPSDPMRVYVSGLTGNAGAFKGSLAVSIDRGQSWALFTVPSSDGDHTPYIGAIDPGNPERVYLRTDGTPGRLYAFDYATVKFSELFVGQGILRGFALSPSGQTMLVGGSSDGIWRAPAATLSFEKMSAVATRCLTWTGAGVYSCATEFADGFTVGLSKDEGATFDAVMHLPCVRGPLECGADTTAGKLCPAEWPAVATQIGQAECAQGSTSGSGGGSTTTGAGGSGGAGTGGAGTGGTGGTTTGAGGTATNGAGGTAGSTNGGPAKSSCACSLGGEGSGPGGAFAALAAVLLLFRRGRPRATARA